MVISTRNPVFLRGFACIVLGLSFATITLQGEESSMQFTYLGSTGPENWGNLSPTFKACSDGKKQSPVNITTDRVTLNTNLKQLTRDYRPAKATLVNNRFNIGVRYDENLGVLVLNGKNYTLEQMHWHSPSEHRINAVQYAAELHLVHKASDGSMTVMSILYQYGDADPLISLLQKGIEGLPCEKCSKVEVSIGTVYFEYLKENTHQYYTYIGSLTTPPCTENIIWNVLGKVRTVSKEQVAMLKAPLEDACKDNSRPEQSLNGRTVELYAGQNGN